MEIGKSCKPLWIYLCAKVGLSASLHLQLLLSGIVITNRIILKQQVICIPFSPLLLNYYYFFFEEFISFWTERRHGEWVQPAVCSSEGGLSWMPSKCSLKFCQSGQSVSEQRVSKQLSEFLYCTPKQAE